MVSKVDGTSLLLYAYIETLFSYAIPGNKAVKMLASEKGLIPLQSKMAQYANVSVRLDKKVKGELTFHVHLKIMRNLSRSWLHFSLTANRKPWRGRASGIPRLAYSGSLRLQKSALRGRWYSGHLSEVFLILHWTQFILSEENYQRWSPKHQEATKQAVSNQWRNSSGSKEEDTRRKTVMRECAGEYGRDVRE